MPLFEGSGIDHRDGTGVFSPNIGAFVAVGQLLIATCFTAQNDADFSGPGNSTGAGIGDWHPLYYKTGGGSTTKIFYRIAQATGSTPDFTMTAGVSAPTSVVVSGYSDVDPTNPFDGFSQLLAFTDNATPTPPAFTSVTDDALAALWMGSLLDSTFTGGAPSSYTLDADYAGATYDDRQQFIATKDLTTAGTETPGDWTHSASAGNVEDGYQIGMALREPQTEVFPVVQSVALTNAASATSTHFFGAPSGGIGSLDLIIFVARAGSSFSITAEPSGYTRIDGGITGVTNKRMYVGYLEVEGDETFTTLTTSVNTWAAYHTFRITGWNPSFPPTMVEVAGTNVSLIEPELGSNLFVAAFGTDSTQTSGTGTTVDMAVAPHGAPSGYNWLRHRGSPEAADNPVSTHTALRERYTDSEDANAWDAPSGDTWAGLIAVPGGDAGGELVGVGSGWGISI